MIKYVNFFAQLSRHQQYHLLELAAKRPFLRDELIDQLGGHSDSVYIVANGRVKIFELNADGKQIILWFCGAGELFGFSETLVPSTFPSHQINAQAYGQGELLVIKKTDFERFITDNPTTVLPVVRLLGFRLREIMDVLMDVTSSDVTSRVIRLLYRLGAMYGQNTGRGLRIELPITHQEMADMIGASRQTVTTVLGDLKRKGVIETVHRMIVITNMDSMRYLLHPPNKPFQKINKMQGNTLSSQLMESEY